MTRISPYLERGHSLETTRGKSDQIYVVDKSFNNPLYDKDYYKLVFAWLKARPFGKAPLGWWSQVIDDFWPDFKQMYEYLLQICPYCLSEETKAVGDFFICAECHSRIS